jgi:hypothetical protein
MLAENQTLQTLRNTHNIIDHNYCGNTSLYLTMIAGWYINEVHLVVIFFWNLILLNLSHD